MERSLPPKFQDQISQVHEAGKLVPFLRLLTWFGVGGEVFKTAVIEIDGIRQQLDALVELTVSFQDTFLELGWLFSESTNVETAKKALHVHQNGKASEAETLLAADFEGERLDYVIMRMCNLEVFLERKEQLVEAADLTREGRFLAATPLLLIVADGVGSDEFGKSVFAEEVDLEELNSFAGQPDALPELIRNICKTRRKTSSDCLEFPYRHGIIHGRDLGYGNRLVNAKCWSLLGNIADVIEARKAAKSLESVPESSLRDVLKSYAQTNKLQKRISDWVKRPVVDKPVHVSAESMSSLNESEPEATLAGFFEAWKAGNYGRMAQMTMYPDQASINSRAGEIRKLMQGLTLVDAVITRIEDFASALTEITADLTFCLEGQEFVNDFVFRMICQDGKGGAAVRGYDGAQWLIRPEYQYRYWAEQRGHAKD